MNKKAIVLYLHVHQPFRVRHYTIFDAGVDHRYFDAPYDDRTSNERIVHKVAEKSGQYYQECSRIWICEKHRYQGLAF